MLEEKEIIRLTKLIQLEREVIKINKEIQEKNTQRDSIIQDIIKLREFNTENFVEYVQQFY